MGEDGQWHRLVLLKTVVRKLPERGTVDFSARNLLNTGRVVGVLPTKTFRNRFVVVIVAVTVANAQYACRPRPLPKGGNAVNGEMKRTRRFIVVGSCPRAPREVFIENTAAAGLTVRWWKGQRNGEILRAGGRACLARTKKCAYVHTHRFSCVPRARSDYANVTLSSRFTSLPTASSRIRSSLFVPVTNVSSSIYFVLLWSSVITIRYAKHELLVHISRTVTVNGYGRDTYVGFGSPKR